MGYSETMCQLCGVSFAIARIRTAYEPTEAAWSYTGDGFVDNHGREAVEESCGKSSGCQTLERAGLYGGDEVGMEHVAGPGCVSGQGYSGYQISVQEMEGCRAVQCLMQKGDDWEAEDDDQDFELKSNYFLTGLGNGSPDESALEPIEPARHGIADVVINNCNWDFFDVECGLPFHPTCFEIFKKISQARLDRVDVHGLWEWRSLECSYKSFFENFPREIAVKIGYRQWWQHERGSEYLAANPIEVPGLTSLLKTCHREMIYGEPYDVNAGVFGRSNEIVHEPGPGHHRTPQPATSPSADIFMKWPNELLYTIVDNLSSKDVANLRLVTRAYRQLPLIMFRKFLLKDMPWLWEVRDLPKDKTDWFQLYKSMRGCWQNIKGLRNRKRVWKDVNEIVTRIERLRESGEIVDE